MDYLLCTTPRVGSNLLCSFLTHTGVAGVPREYLCPHEIAERGPALCGVSTVEGTPAAFPRYYAACRSEFSRGGRFGVKAHLHQLRWALERGFDLDGNFPDRVVLLSRADLVGQALSFARAAQTGAWLAAKHERIAPRYDAALVRRALAEIVAENEAWERLFRGYGVEPYRLAYERLTADFEGELAGVLRFLDVDTDGLDLAAVVERATSYHRRQRDAASDEWRRLWAEDLRRAAVARGARTAAATA